MSKTVLVKTLSLGLAATLTAGVFGYLFANFIATGTLTSLIYALVAGVFFLAAFLIQVLLSKNRGLTAVSVVTSVLAMSVFFLIKFAFFFVDWLAVLLAWAVFKILLAARFFRFDLQTVPKKVIMLE
jgi:hypothetical protein